jgi:hypothetical protein
MAWTNILGQTRVGVRGAQAQTLSLLLDSYSGAAAAYSLRKLTSTYTGDAIRVRRSSDNAEQNIGFDAGGNLNTIALLAFVGSGSGFVTTWYDQSGNGKNATQTTSNSQPQIVDNGSILLDGTKPTIKFTSTSQQQLTGTQTSPNGLNTMTMIFAGKTTGGLSGDGFSSGVMSYYQDLGWGSVYMGLSTTKSDFRFGTGQVITPPSFNGSFSRVVYLLIKNGSSEVATINGSDVYSVNDRLSTIGNTGTAFSIGYSPRGATYFSGNMSEILIYPTNQTSNKLGISTNINSYYSIYPTDADALAFVNAAGITDTTQMSAINTLVTDLKTANIWTKMKAVYPFVGGSAASHRFNLKDPRTVDAAFYLDFYGGITHTSAGATFNGTTGYADMKLMRSQLFTNTDGMIGMYTPTLSSSGSLFAVSNMINADFSGYYNGTQLSNNMYPNTSVSYTTQLKGFNCFDVFINVVTCRSIFKNGVKVAFGSGYSNISPDYKVYMAATNRAGTSYGDNFAGVYSFSFFSNTLTASENTSLYNAVQAFQTTLGRAV